MTVPAEIQAYIEEGDWDRLEDAWVRRLTARPGEVEPLAAAARALAAVDEEERARFLLELVDGELAERGLWRARLALLRRAGSLLTEPEALHGEILATLERIHAERPSFAGMAEAVGLRRATHDVPKTWEKADRLEQLLAYDVGTIVAMAGRGVGTVVEANFQLESLKVDFAGHGPLQVGFRAAPKMLEPLGESHILRRKLEAPEELERIAAEDPSELLRIVLTSRGRPMTAGEIRQDLAGIVSEARWTSFWSAARKHPQLVVSGKGRQTYAWAESAGHAEDTVWSSFERAAPRARLELFRRETGPGPTGGRRELSDRMAAGLARLGAEAMADDPGLAFEIHAALERAGRGGEAAVLAPAVLLAGPRDRAEALLAGVEDRSLRERAYAAVRETRDDWREIFVARLLREDEPRSLDRMLETFRADDEDAGDAGLPREAVRFLDGLLAQPHRRPAAFVWLAERAAGDPALRGRNPLRMLQQILTGIGRDHFAPWRQKLKDMADTGGTLPRLLPHLGREQAVAAREAIHRTAGLEAYQRDNLNQALELRFPELRGESRTSDVLHALPASIAAKRAELDRITKRELPANRRAIEEARAMGDLRENFEYKAARQRHEVLSAMATELDRDLHRARPIDLAAIDPGQVRVGTRVTLAVDGGATREVIVLGPWESAPERGVVSYETELGARLLSKRVGDEVEVDGAPARIAAIAVATPPG